MCTSIYFLYVFVNAQLLAYNRKVSPIRPTGHNEIVKMASFASNQKGLLLRDSFTSDQKIYILFSWLSSRSFTRIEKTNVQNGQTVGIRSNRVDKDFRAAMRKSILVLTFKKCAKRH